MRDPNVNAKDVPMPKRRIICQAVWRPGEPWPYCMCQQRSLPGEDYCAKHMPNDQIDGSLHERGEVAGEIDGSPATQCQQSPCDHFDHDLPGEQFDGTEGA